MKQALGMGGIILLCLSLPAANFVLIVRMVCDFTVPDVLASVAAIAIGCALGLCCLILLVRWLAPGGEFLLMDLIPPSFVFLMLLLLLAPAFHRVAHNRRAIHFQQDHTAQQGQHH